MDHWDSGDLSFCSRYKRCPSSDLCRQSSASVHILPFLYEPSQPKYEDEILLPLPWLCCGGLCAAPTLPGEGAYSASNLIDLLDVPTSVTQPLANQLLDVLQKNGLTKNFGVVGVHSHVAIAPGQVMFQHGTVARPSRTKRSKPTTT
ncbi:hypothetical protein MVEN_00254000 [Mycena venus]|uniref:Uncharacterized protein n=1 Tax=Mycena venus TaxID=2733690 RepID=A0A8H6YZA5_9AGAR|nr:hypothetical protein MVEN_00254000 [Mycena venus]